MSLDKRSDICRDHGGEITQFVTSHTQRSLRTPQHEVHVDTCDSGLLAKSDEDARLKRYTNVAEIAESYDNFEALIHVDEVNWLEIVDHSDQEDGNVFTDHPVPSQKGSRDMRDIRLKHFKFSLLQPAISCHGPPKQKSTSSLLKQIELLNQVSISMASVTATHRHAQRTSDIVRLQYPNGGDCVAPAPRQNVDREDGLRWPDARANFYLIKFEHDSLVYRALSDLEDLERFRRVSH
ncbi:hypothetical protein BO86DRAFT_394682 [Aspergillus japonicus CBS 114.51]|uniref:Uncharacterized protein n=1 Tax=Aspergillus japonicus CBS 114.51 TaxID=1448312 RepID=A0A8T8XHL8_ASPJA|nr:hypothetical protein BO86DRAFT_394682 [Aspergillus japonicus CBS 114.51]RAH86889.1 hypothetical protein BO86DRAFT_394682 [Aspergillus japonicus CBS 114.51]